MSDWNFNCRCGGNLIEVKKLENGRRVFNCDKCKNNECLECSICHNPRGIWADDGLICGLCALDWLSGKIIFSKEQGAGILEWRVEGKFPPSPE